MTDRSTEVRSGGILAIWTDIAPELEAEFNEWYWREHFPERLSIPGFRSAQRYRAFEGAPRYLAWYELDGIEVLESPFYQERLHHPTEWTRRVTAGFRNYTRASFRRLAQFGAVAGAVILTLRLPATASGPRADALRRLSADRGVTRVQLWQAVETGAPIPRELAAFDTAGKSALQVVTVEAVDADVLAETTARIDRFDISASATYQFLCGQHADW